VPKIAFNNSNFDFCQSLFDT